MAELIREEMAFRNRALREALAELGMTMLDLEAESGWEPIWTMPRRYKGGADARLTL